MKNIVKNKFANDKILIILVTILIILSLSIIIVKFISRNNIDPESPLVTDLHNYLSSDDLKKCEGLFNYSDKKIEYNNVNSETKICLAYQKADIEVIDTLSLKTSKKKNTCKQDNMIFKEDQDGSKKCSVSKIDRKNLETTYKKLYGKEIENNKIFKIDNLHVCYLNGDYYYCGLSDTATYILGSDSNIYRVIKKAVEKGSEVIIYDYFIKINDGTCYKNYTSSTTNPECSEAYKNDKKLNYSFMKKYGTLYKHTFKKADNDTYYWISSEPIS